MAYMNQEKKTKIAAALKKVVPAGWKYSLSVKNHMSIVMTITSAPVDLIGAFNATQYFDPLNTTYTNVNNYHYRNHLADQSVADIFEKIFECLNIDNFDNSDPMTDYFHVGHYVDLNIGKWNKPFVVTEQLKKAA